MTNNTFNKAAWCADEAAVWAARSATEAAAGAADAARWAAEAADAARWAAWDAYYAEEKTTNE